MRGRVKGITRFMGFGKTDPEWRGPGWPGMKVYIAARYDQHKYAKWVADKFLRPAGFEVVSTWINGNEKSVPDKYENPSGHDQAMARVAHADLHELGQADCMLMLGDDRPSGGRNFEMGYAYCKDINIFTVGDCEHVFHYLPETYALHFDTVESWIAYMKNGVTNAE